MPKILTTKALTRDILQSYKASEDAKKDQSWGLPVTYDRKSEKVKSENDLYWYIKGWYLYVDHVFSCLEAVSSPFYTILRLSFSSKRMLRKLTDQGYVS